jgi:type 1 glutamine amidotransferase
MKRFGVVGGTIAFCGLMIWGQPAVQSAPAGPQQAPGVQLAPGQGGARAAGRGAGRGGRARKVVLAWADTRNGIAQHDSVSHALAVIERLGYESGAYDTYIRTDSNIIAKQPLMTSGAPASGGPSLSNVDGIFFLGHREIALEPQQRSELAAFVREGKGFVAAHTALTAFESWPEFGELLGGRYDDHPWGVAGGTIITEDRSFPATKHFAATFPFVDEFYQTREFSRDKLRVLLRLDVAKMPSTPQLRRADRDLPLAWAKMYGKGRVFYSSLGHGPEMWDNRDIAQMYFEAVKWSLGLTEGDATPRPLPAP